MNVLVAEDDLVSRHMLTKVISGWGYEVSAAADGLEAWEMLRKPGAPSLVILDWSMPGLEGIEVCRRVRELPDRSPYIILLTSRDRQTDIVEGLRTGADDYLTKPYDREELQARLNVGARIIRLQSALSRQLFEIDDTLHRIQNSFLLGECPDGLEGFQVAAAMFPSETVAGDFYDFFRHHKRCFDVVVGDVMGKGTKAALFGAATTTRILRSMNEMMSELDSAPQPQPEAILDRVNRKMTPQLAEVGSFVTLCFARFDLDAALCTFVDAGHVKTIHYRADLERAGFLEGQNLPVGFSETEDYRQQRVQLHEGDIFLFYSDGLSELRDPQGQMFGAERLASLVEAGRLDSVDGLIARIRQASVQFAGSSAFNDDLTCVAVKIAPQAIHDLRDELQVRSDPLNLGEIRRFVRSFCQRLQGPALDEREVFFLELATHEAVVVAMRTAYAGDPTKPIIIRARSTANTIVLQVVDEGIALDLERLPKPGSDCTSENALGVYIMGQAMDQVTYEKDEQGRNCMTLVKRVG